MSTLTVAEAMVLIDELDLEPIIFKLVNPEDGTPLSLAQADVVTMKYRQYLKLCAMYPGKSIVPNKEIDQVWHTHILDTAKYRDDCDQVFGKFLDHFPYFGLRGEEDAQNLKTAYAVTLDLFRNHFGAELAGAQQGCGESCGGSLCENPACSGSACTGTIDRCRPRIDRDELLISA
ncbi:hypothetical protein H0W80_04965 [Candidatus Saccharibacteria bacterium]|nr:hypothetical protein [Candidatus Saccharibacteria bacterium]